MAAGDEVFTILGIGGLRIEESHAEGRAIFLEARTHLTEAQWRELAAAVDQHLNRKRAMDAERKVTP